MRNQDVLVTIAVSFLSRSSNRRSSFIGKSIYSAAVHEADYTEISQIKVISLFTLRNNHFSFFFFALMFLGSLFPR